MVDYGNKNKKIAKNTLFLYLRMFFVLGVSLYTTRVVFRVLGVVDYGIYNVVNGFVVLFSFLNTSLANGVQRFYSYSIGAKNEYTVRQVYNMALFIQLIFGILIVLIVEMVGVWYIHNYMTIPYERLNSALLVFHSGTLSLFFVLLQIPYNAAIIAYERMDYYAIVNILDVLARLVAIILLPFIDSDKLALYGWILLIINIFDFALYSVYCKFNFSDIRLSLTFHSKLFKEMMVFSGWNIFGTFAYVMQSQGLNLLLNGFFGVVLNSARGIANMIQAAVQGFQGNIVLAFRPQMVQSYAEHDVRRVADIFTWMSKLSYIMLLIIITPLILELHFILNLWLGDDVPDDTYVFTFLVLVNMLFSSLNTPVTQIIHASGKMKAYQITTGVVTFMVIPVSWIALHYGLPPYSVFLICVIFTILNQCACLYVMNRIFPIDFRRYIGNIICPLLLATILSPIVGYYITKMMEETFLRFVLVGFSSVVCCLAISYMIVLQKEEKNRFINFIKNKLKR